MTVTTLTINYKVDYMASWFYLPRMAIQQLQPSVNTVTEAILNAPQDVPVMAEMMPLVWVGWEALNLTHRIDFQLLNSSMSPTRCCMEELIAGFGLSVFCVV